MITGIQALHKLDTALRQVRHAVNQVDKELNHASVSLQKNRQLQAKLLSRLATLRLRELDSGELAGHRELEDERALDILRNRESAYDSLEQAISSTSARLDASETERDALVEIRSAHAQKVIDCEHDIQHALESDDAYQQHLERTRQQDMVAEEAERKARFALEDRTEKGKPFEDDPLFSYLWKRDYGTPDYKGGVLGRLLDGWVAKRCDFNNYRVNYWTLLKIPQRLRSHADEALQDAEQLLQQLTELEMQAANKAGLAELQDQLRTAQATVDAMDDDIAEIENKYNQQLRERAQFAQAQDSHMIQSLQVLVEAMSEKSPAQLELAAAQTQHPQDDQDALRLADLREQQRDLQDELLDHRKLHEAKLSRVHEMEAVRRNFKSHRYDDLRSGFGNEELISTLLNQFLSGLVGGNDLWRSLKRHQRHRDVGAWPDFGSAGIRVPGGIQRGRRMPRTRSPWHVPRGRRSAGGGGFRLPNSGGGSSRGGRSGGGFRTGGGF